MTENPSNLDLHAQLMQLAEDAKVHVQKNVQPSTVELEHGVDIIAPKDIK